MFRHEKFQTTIQNTVLRILSTNPSFTPETLGKLLGLSTDEVAEIIAKMIEDGMLNEEGEPIETPEDEVFTVYKYEKRSDVTGPAIKDTTRPFCASLVRQSSFKSWTIEDIELMNNGTGLDVFTSRGGWMTLPDRSPAVHVPFCRHIWKAVLVRRKPT
jgi:hypothetical protein